MKYGIYREGNGFGFCTLDADGAPAHYFAPDFGNAASAREALRNTERRRRIHLGVWAYAYERLDHSVVSDGVFDDTAKAVDLSIATGDDTMDAWFRANFDPFTGVWVHNHPGKERLREIALNIIGG